MYKIDVRCAYTGKRVRSAAGAYVAHASLPESRSSALAQAVSIPQHGLRDLPGLSDPGFQKAIVVQDHSCT